ncbi:MAG: hypothetical protein OJF58_005336 [Enhydrobacter sp.]|nr:MAG: hypothetical protein OJF58_005336 [Enhydrobacter sp.]
MDRALPARSCLADGRARWKRAVRLTSPPLEGFLRTVDL